MAEHRSGLRLDGRLALALVLLAGIAAIGIASVAGGDPPLALGNAT